MRSGQISIAVLSVIGMFFTASIGISWQAFSKSDHALEQVSDLRERTATIDGKLDILLGRLGITQTEANKILGAASSSSSQPINGY